MPGEVRIQVSISDATVVKNFYVVQLDDGSQSDEAEDLFGAVEGNAVTAIRTLTDQRVWPIPGDVRTALAEWVALQYLRVPWVRQLTREIAEGFCGVGIPITTGSGEHITLQMPAEEVDRLSGPGLHIEFIKRQAAQVAEMLYDRDWVLTFYKRRSLATSDTPVVLRPTLGHPATRGIGIANAGEIHGNWIGSALLFFFPLERGSVGVYLRVRLGRGVVRLCPMRPSFVMMRPGCVLRTRG